MLSRTIPLDGVEGRIDHLDLDASARRLYVAAIGNNTVEVIDLAVGARLASIRGLNRPTGVRVLPGSGNVVVASGGDGKVLIFDHDLHLLHTNDHLDDADNVRLDADGKLAYVGFGNGALAVVDPLEGKLIGQIKLDAHPESFQLESGGKRVFVNVPDAGQICVVDRTARSVVATWQVRDASANFPMALDEQDHRLFVACRKPATLLVFDTETGKEVARLACCGDADDIFYDPQLKRIYVSGGAGAVSVIEHADPDHYRLLDDLATAPGARTSFYDAAHGELYVAFPKRGSGRAEFRVYSSRPTPTTVPGR
jgi:DNA-binding beta-propeller fold protein YncE